MGKALNEVLRYLDGFLNYERETGYSYSASYYKLARVKVLLEYLGNPEKKVSYIHITGTKGKGSTAEYAARLLQSCGLRTGLYTSPHLVSFKERNEVGRRI